MPMLFFDLETVPRDGAEQFLAEPSAPSNYKDMGKIEAYKMEARDKNAAKLSLSPYGCRIVVLGMGWENGERIAEVFRTEGEERDGLCRFVRAAVGCDLVGHNIRAFDLQVVLGRCRLLGVKFPYHWANPKWLKSGSSIIDLYDLCTFGQGRYSDDVISHGLVSMCRVFGVEREEPDITGAQVAECIALGDYETVRTHCLRDVERTMALAKALNVADMRAAGGAWREDGGNPFGIGEAS